MFKIVGPIKIHGPDSSIQTYAYLDGGSSVTLLDRFIYDSLKLRGENESLRLQWTKGVIREEDAMKTSFHLTGTNQQKIFEISDAFGVSNLDLPIQSLDAKLLQEKYPHLRGLPSLSSMTS